MSSPDSLTISARVVRETVRAAALEVPGVVRVGRAGPAWRRLLGGPPVSARLRGSGVSVRLWIVASPGQALGPLARQVRTAVAAAVERLLGLELEAVTVLVDGVGN